MSKEITNYRKAFIEFKKTIEYKNVSKSLQNYGVKQPYRDSIIMECFSAGWGNRHIDFIDPSNKPCENNSDNNDDD